MPLPFQFNGDFSQAESNMNHLTNCHTEQCLECGNIVDDGLFYYCFKYTYKVMLLYILPLIGVTGDCYNEIRPFSFKKHLIRLSIMIIVQLLMLSRFIYKFIKKSHYWTNFRALNKNFKIFILSSRLDKVDNELLDRKATITSVSRFL